MAAFLRYRDQPGTCRTAEGLTVALLASHEPLDEAYENGCELRAVEFTRGKIKQQTLAAYWPREVSPQASCAMRLPEQWQDLAFVMVNGQNLLVNPGHPLVRLLPPSEWGALSNATWHHYEWAPSLDAAATAAEAASSVLKVLALLLRVDSGGRIEAYREQRQAHLQHLWQLIAKASGTPLEHLRALGTDGSSDVLLTPSEYQRSEPTYGQPSLLPPVTDPAWLLYEEDEGQADAWVAD